MRRERPRASVKGLASGLMPSAWVRQRRALTAVARGAAPADRYVRGGTVLNVYTGELYLANVAIQGERIAYVGLREDMVGSRTEVISAENRILSPGYLEPHAHPWKLATPAALARQVLPHGTTTIVADNLPIYELAGPRGFEAAVRALARCPVRFFWLVRLHAQSRSRGEDNRFPLRTLARLLDNPWVVGAGEVTRWPEAWAGDQSVLVRLALAPARGKRIEGHTAGASAERLAGLAAVGVGSCHEPITAQEVLDRARMGIAVMLRENSLRPDLAALLPALKDAPALAHRVMLTTDGSSPAFIADHGLSDHLVGVAMARGVPPVDAYRMATLNPATYFGLDQEVGGIAPGRYADLLLLRHLGEPSPETVVAREGQLRVRISEPAWARMFSSRAARLDVRWRATAEDFQRPAARELPVMGLVSAVITRLEEREPREGDLRAALLDREGRWICQAALAGFCSELDGLATTLSTDFHVLALGRDPQALARAVNRLLALSGGIVLVEAGRVLYELALPIGGLMAAEPFHRLAERDRELTALLKGRGYRHRDPLYSLLFLTADFLPEVRLTAQGVWDVKGQRVLSPSRPFRHR